MYNLIQVNSSITRKTGLLLLLAIIALVVITGAIITTITKILIQADSSKIQIIQPIILVLIGLLPSIATILISELVKSRSAIHLKEIEKKEEMLSKREAMYKSLLENIEGFIVPEDENKKSVFFKEYRIAWLYANDEVLRAIKDFLDSVVRENSLSNKERGERYQAIISSMRNDIVTLKPLSNTTLDSKDFSNVGSIKSRL